MTRPVFVLRPEPGGAATLRRLAAAGVVAKALPLFAVRRRDWSPPDPSTFDALVLTSANAVRCAGDRLEALARLPVYAVGEATARAARDAGLQVAHVGAGDAAALFAAMAPHVGHALWLAGAERRPVTGPAPRLTVVEVYASDPLPVADAPARLAGGVALVHSPRAGARLAALVPQEARGTIDIVAISARAGDAAGTGWAGLTIAERPDDATLVAAAIDRARRGADKRSR